MKKYQKIAYIFLVIFVLSIVFILFKSYADINKNEDEKEKTETEIQRIELSFVNMFNELNNIKFENYRINTSQINKEDLKDNSSSSASETTPSSGGSSSSESSSSGDQGESQKENGSSQSSEESKENQNYEYEFQGEVYTFDKLSKKINDKNIKKELESEKRYRKCHLKSAEIATSLPKSCILTGYVKRYDGKFLHSIVEIEKEDGKYIIDYTKNIIMPKEQYVKLTEFEELESISDLEYLEYIQRLENIPDLNGKVLLTFGREIFKELEKNSFLIKNDEELEKIIDNIKEYKLKERENNSKEIDNEERE